MKTALAAILCFSFLNLAAQSPRAQKPSAASRAQSAAATTPAATSALNTSLADLERIATATQSDLADFRPEKRSAGWKTSWMFWHRGSSHNQQADQIAASLQKNLRDAMPSLIHNAQNSGTFAATFKLYNNLSVVCELLDSLVEATKSEGKGDGPLANDSAAMGRIRQDLAAYVEQAASALDSKGKPYALSSTTPSATGKPKKIVIDDTIPEKKPKKKTASDQ